MASKVIELKSGTIITKRKGDDYDEIWDIESKAIANTVINLDLTSCTGCDVDGHEGESYVTEIVGPMENRCLFYIRRNPPFRFAAKINMTEEPIPIEEQDYYLKDQIDSLEQKIDVIKALVEGIPFENIDENYMQNHLSGYGIDHFIDPSFPPDDTSIWDQSNNDPYPLNEKPVWKRAKDFMDETPQLFLDGIDPNDINQGLLGDCWFLASIASIAENPALVRRLFVTQSYNECGFYKLKICKDGEWIEVVVDDYFPCYCNGGPMFSRGKGAELWVLLLEKAYAKLHGNYCMLRNGFVAHGMSDLTGCPTYFNKFPSDRRNFYQIESYANDIWQKLLKADRKGYIMCASTPGVDVYTESNGPDQESGIVAGHAYSVISCKEYDGIRLLKIRNPWGRFEWGGAWSDNSSKWTQEYIDYFQPDFNNQDGTFWICIEDFFKNFESITVCKVSDWNEVRLKGKFIRLWENEDEDEDWVLSKFYYSFHLNEAAKIDICLHQEDKRILGADKRRYVEMQILILKRNDDGTITFYHDSSSKCDRDVETCVSFEPGHYVVVPRTCGATMSVPSNPTSPVDLYYTFRGRKILHPIYFSTINDIFRKMDLEMNGILSSKELYQFGQLIDDGKWMSYSQEDFSNSTFEGISHTPEGITKYGFMQLMLKEESWKLNDIFLKLGYDESLYSLKSKVYTISFHTYSDLRVRVGDACKTELNERAWDLMMENHKNKFGATGACQTNRVIVFRNQCQDSNSVCYGAINKSDNEIEIVFDQTKSSKMLYSPSKGSVRTVIPPRAIVYLASSIMAPEFNQYTYSYTFNEKILS